MSDSVNATTVASDDAVVGEDTDQRVRDAYWEGYTFALRGIVAGDPGVEADLEEQRHVVRNAVLGTE